MSVVETVPLTINPVMEAQPQSPELTNLRPYAPTLLGAAALEYGGLIYGAASHDTKAMAAGLILGAGTALATAYKMIKDGLFTSQSL